MSLAAFCMSGITRVYQNIGAYPRESMRNCLPVPGRVLPKRHPKMRRGIFC